MKIISFSFFRTSNPKKVGKTDQYVRGARVNMEVAPKVYPGWQVYIYCGRHSVFGEEAKELESMGAKIKWFDDNFRDWYGSFVRFDPAGTEDVVIVRDIDSVLNWREKAAVDEWLESGKQWHVMRDHVHHNCPIPAGMWGCRKGAIKNTRAKVDNWVSQTNPDEKWACDQDFLKKEVWPIAQKDCMQHDIQDRKFNDGWRAFPVHRSIYPCSHVGQAIQRTDFADTFLEEI